MKGIAAATMIVLIVAVVITAGFILPSLLGASEDAVRSAARTQADHVTGVVNFMHSSPVGAKHTFDMPDVDCTFRFTPVGVNVSVSSIMASSAEAEFVQVEGSELLLEDGEKAFDCKRDAFITLLRCSGGVKVGGVSCD